MSSRHPLNFCSVSKYVRVGVVDRPLWPLPVHYQSRRSHVTAHVHAWPIVVSCPDPTHRYAKRVGSGHETRPIDHHHASCACIASFPCPGSSRFSNVARRKRREPGKIYHVNDVGWMEGLGTWPRDLAERAARARSTVDIESGPYVRSSFFI